MSLVLLLLGGCSSTKKKPEAVELSELKGQKVALVELTGTPTSKKVVEVALVNQLVKNGSFILLAKKDVETARTHFQQDPRKWQQIAKRAGADYALRVNVFEFQAEEAEGYSREKKYDSQLAEERGEDDATLDRLYKVKELRGKVRFGIEFTQLASGEVKSGVAFEEDAVQADEKKEAIHLPPRLRYLEDLSNRAFAKFFEQYR